MKVDPKATPKKATVTAVLTGQARSHQERARKTTRSWVSSDHPKRRRPNQDGLHHPLRGIRLQDHVLRVEERWCYLLTRDTAVPDQLHCNVQAYVDDVVVKTKTQDQFITDLEETFNSLRKFRWKLNPTKCVFGVPSENYSDSSSVTEELRLIQRRSMPSWPCVGTP